MPGLGGIGADFALLWWYWLLLRIKLLAYDGDGGGADDDGDAATKLPSVSVLDVGADVRGGRMAMVGPTPTDPVAPLLYE